MHILTRVAHRKELLWILSIAFPSKGLWHGKPEVESGVVMGLYLAIAALSASGGMGRVLDGVVDVTQGMI